MINLNTASLSDLKGYATENAIAIEGDRRRKQSYIDSIKDHWDATGTTEAIAQSVDVAKTVFVQDEPFTVEQPATAKLSSAVCLQPFAFVLAAIILGAVWLAIGVGVVIIRLARWITPYALNILEYLEERWGDSSCKHRFSRAIPIPVKY